MIPWVEVESAAFFSNSCSDFSGALAMAASTWTTACSLLHEICSSTVMYKICCSASWLYSCPYSGEAILMSHLLCAGPKSPCSLGCTRVCPEDFAPRAVIQLCPSSAIVLKMFITVVEYATQLWDIKIILTCFRFPVPFGCALLLSLSITLQKVEDIQTVPLSPQDSGNSIVICQNNLLFFG